SKGGIRKVAFDFSEEHILAAVDGSLAALRTDYLDLLLLHRPDALVEPEEVAAAFDKLQAAGKVPISAFPTRRRARSNCSRPRSNSHWWSIRCSSASPTPP
ncbi:MAG: aldo/keto reductase, partial [Devosia sp.]|uniref:aldo/keto reductase n=1 Tax=Devosia sp. TaxID=1871048 RepID=UPI00260FFAC8